MMTGLGGALLLVGCASPRQMSDSDRRFPQPVEARNQVLTTYSVVVEKEPSGCGLAAGFIHSAEDGSIEDSGLLGPRRIPCDETTEVGGMRFRCGCPAKALKVLYRAEWIADPNALGCMLKGNSLPFEPIKTDQTDWRPLPCGLSVDAAGMKMTCACDSGGAGGQ